MTNSKTEMEKLLEIVFSFEIQTNIKINKEKSDLIVINLPKLAFDKEHKISIPFGYDSLTYKKKQKSIRYLGIFLDYDGQKCEQDKIIMKKAGFTAMMLSKSKSTDKQC